MGLEPMDFRYEFNWGARLSTIGFNFSTSCLDKSFSFESATEEMLRFIERSASYSDKAPVILETSASSSF